MIWVAAAAIVLFYNLEWPWLLVFSIFYFWMTLFSGSGGWMSLSLALIFSFGSFVMHSLFYRY
jgi:hypothetical protein